jgi:sugar (pentulose or hexulose) kinase
MSRVLLVDFGASRVKAALWDLGASECVGRAEAPSPDVAPRADGRVELAPEGYWRALEATAGALLETPAGADVRELWLCTEMHGFLLADERWRPSTGYVSWRDQRAARDGAAGGPSTLQSLQGEAGERFRRVTGMRLRSGLPWVTLASMARAGALPAGRLGVLTLADWLVVRGGGGEPRADLTLAAGTGLVDVSSGERSAELLQLAGLPVERMSLPSVAAPGEPLGEIALAGRRVAVHGGVGDLQAALLGAGLGAPETGVVNLGTGSQVASGGEDAPAAPFELRPAARGGTLRAFTHIPSGRALAAVARWLDGCAAAGGGRPFFWELWAELGAEEVLRSPVTADLNLFDAAWRSGPDAGWLSLREEWLEPRTMLAGIARAWLDQYRQALALLDPAGALRTLRVAGGLAHRGGFVLPVLAALCGRETSFAETRTGEETLEGLRLLAEERATHRSSTASLAPG